MSSVTTHKSSVFAGWRLATLVFAVIPASISCGEGSAPRTPEAALLEVSAGNAQFAEVGQPLPDSLAVIARSAGGEPVAGVTVLWTVSAGNGSVSPTMSVTNASGVARTRHVVGANVGAQEVTASAATLDLVTFAATARLNGAVTFGDRTIGPATDTTLGTNDQPLVVMVINEKNEPVPGFVVTWTASGGGSVSETSQPTDAGGESVVYFTYGPVAGEQYAQASAPGLIGSPIDFVMLASAGNPVALEKQSGDGLTVAPAGQVIYRVVTKDARGNPRNGVAIQWTVGSGGGSITPSQNITGGNGTAEALRTLGSSAGTHTAIATAPDIPGAPSVTFTTTTVAIRQ